MWTDKQFPNNIVPAIKNIAADLNPVYLRDLFEENKNAYFATESKDNTEIRQFHNEVKKYIYDKFINNYLNILDLGCGLGQDLYKYLKKQPRHITALDPVIESLVEY